MYGAKATAITKVALDVWAPGKVPSPKTRAAIERACFALHRDRNATLSNDNDFPELLLNDEFKRLVLSLDAAAFSG